MEIALILLPNESEFVINKTITKDIIMYETFVIGKKAICKPSQKSFKRLELLITRYIIKIHPIMFLKILPPRYSEISIISCEPKFLSNLYIR